MEAKIIEILNQIRNFVWGLPLIILLLGTGIFLTIRVKVLQIRALPHSLYLALIKRKEDSDEAGDLSLIHI